MSDGKPIGLKQALVVTHKDYKTPISYEAQWPQLMQWPELPAPVFREPMTLHGTLKLEIPLIYDYRKFCIEADGSLTVFCRHFFWPGDIQFRANKEDGDKFVEALEVEGLFLYRACVPLSRKERNIIGARIERAYKDGIFRNV